MPSLFFLHIEKTAGTSLRSIVEQQFPEDSVYPAYHQDDLLDSKNIDKSGYQLIRGHFRYEVIKYWFGSVPPMMTMLREPMARTLSHLSYLQRDRKDNQAIRGRMPVNEMSMEELIFDPQISHYLQDFQTKKIALAYDPEGKNAANRLGDANAVLTALEFETALQRLDVCAYVGVTETFERSLELLSQQFDWQLPVSVPRLNQAPDEQKYQLSQRAIQKLEEMLQLDFKLYRYGQAIFEQRYAKNC